MTALAGSGSGVVGPGVDGLTSGSSTTFSSSLVLVSVLLSLLSSVVSLSYVSVLSLVLLLSLSSLLLLSLLSGGGGM